jgi:hypothetical protein
VKLAAYRIVHFATHGALAGEIKGGTERGLLFTPPGEAISSEIACLKLDADWVILHGGRRCGRSRGAVRRVARLLLCGRPRAACVALGGRLGCDREADHQNPERNRR